MLIALLCWIGTASADLVINTNSGAVQGISSLEENVEAFLGIPYAEPPVGDLRFARPVPKKKWADVHIASELPPPCPQISFDPHYHYFMPEISNMSEDCLYLNIWSPKSMSNDSLRPVIIYIHPGGYVTGSSNLKAHDGSHLASHGDLIVVTINYRLGALGFFLAYTEEANGNMGMFDQIMAIQWIKDNAKHFGGNPYNIVLMGASAGAYSIAAHMISPLSKHLFNKVIIESGSIILPFVMDNNTGLFQNSKQVAAQLDCVNDNVTLSNDPKAVIKCMKNKSIKDILKIERAIFDMSPAVFYPRVNDEFLPATKSIAELFREGKYRNDVDVLTGFTEEEGSLFLMVTLPDYFGDFGRNYADNLSKVRALTISRAILLAFKQRNAAEITKPYMSMVKNRTSIEYTKMLSNLVGDFLTSCSTIFLADFLSLKGSNVYFYKFAFRAASSPLSKWMGTTHLDELQYVFGNPYHKNFTEEELDLSHLLMDRWSTFARTGNPNIRGHIPWFKYTYETPLYLNFGQNEETIRIRPNDRCKIWRKRFNSHFDDELIEFLRRSRMDGDSVSIESVTDEFLNQSSQEETSSLPYHADHTTKGFL